MADKVSVRAARVAAVREDIRARRKIVEDANKASKVMRDAATGDSFVNFAHKMGIGADNPLSTGTYGFNPITRIRQLLEWIHRGSWLGGIAVDLIADDMTKMGIELQSDLDPDDIREMEEMAVSLRIWKGLASAVKWQRLFGGSIAVFLISGQRMETPFDIETVGEGQFRGLFVLDRWQVETSLNDMVTEIGPDLGLPKFYKVLSDAPALRGQKIHYSRVMRLEGIELSYHQRLIEQMWGASEVERLYDRMIAFDSATTGAAQLVYRAYFRTYKIKEFRQIVATGGLPLQGLLRYMDMMRRFQTIEGMTLMDSEDEFEGHSTTSFGGLSDVILQFMQQIAGALQIPLVRLLGQSPAGLNATGESDLRTYYDNIKARQEVSFRVPVTKVYRCLAQSAGIELPKGFWIQFRSLWQLSEKEKAEIADIDGKTIIGNRDAGLYSDQTALKELKQSSHITGRGSNITAQDIANADDEAAPRGELAAVEEGAAGADPGAKKPGGDPVDRPVSKEKKGA